MLPKQNRLRLKKDFERIFKQGRGFKQDFLFLKVLENGLKETRFGFIVSQKISQKAVIRNKLKRRLREIIRDELKEGKIRSGVDAALVTLPGLEGKDFQEIKEMTEKLLKKANLTTNNKQ